jgi:putative ABC transport system permease protein
VAPELNGYDETRSVALFDQIFERVGAVPGVRSVALTNPALLSGSVSSTSIYVRGRSYPDSRERRDSINRLIVSPNFFETLEIPVVRGRGFTDADTEHAPRVVLINEAAARQYFPGEDPIGQRFGSSVNGAESRRSSASFATPNTTASGNHLRRRCTTRIGSGVEAAGSSSCGPPPIPRR